MTTLPRQVALVLSQFPASLWAQSLVNALNQFSLEVVQAFRFAQPKYRTVTIVIPALTAVADAFPVVFPVETSPVDVWIAGVSGDTGTDAITVKWAPIVSNGAISVSVNFITGLSSAEDNTYVVRLGYR